MAAKLTRLTYKIAIQLHLVAESCNISISRSRQPARKLLDTPSYGSVSNNKSEVYIQSRLNSGNAYYHSFENLLSFRLLSKTQILI